MVSHSGHEYLTLVDLATYSPFVGKTADHLDMMVHLDSQTRALTLLSWEVPDRALRLRFVITDDDRAAERMGLSYGSNVASGSVRTLNGELCLTGRDRLFDCARHRTHDLLRGRALPRGARPALLSVLPGIYGVQVCRHWSLAWAGEGAGFSGNSAEKIDFTVILRHYPLPAPRIAPIRLPGLRRFGSEEEPFANPAISSIHADPTRRWRQL
jgi:hypothetical protein